MLANTKLDSYSKILACSYCGCKLDFFDINFKCSGCGLVYLYSPSGSLDLRLKQNKRIVLDFEIRIQESKENNVKVEVLNKNHNPEVYFSEKTPKHLTKEMLSYFPKAKTDESLMLDLGCGQGIHKNACENAGFNWVGLDYNNVKAPILGDAHALPFTSEAFEFVLSVAVLEHIQFPFVMIKEVCRVLKPNGVFIGTVAFLEPFHDDSYYHHTHLGVINSLQFGGFQIIKLSPNPNWPVLLAQAKMALFPKMPSMIASSIVMPVHVLHRIWWKIASFISKLATEQKRLQNTSGSFIFIAVKKS